MLEQRDIEQCANDLILAADGDLSRELALRFARHAAESFGLTVRKPAPPPVKREPVDLRPVAAELRKTMGCNCDLDNWEPERSTGHSWVCRIHKAAIAQRASA